jgi:peptide-methionine (R)-S-oxide reductase
MQRRQFILQAGSVTGALVLMGPSVLAHPIDNKINLLPLEKDHDEWRKLVSKPEFYILFEEGTESAGSSPLNHVKQDGTFICAACYLPLFEFDKKYESGTGWPSFYNVIAGRVATEIDLKLIWPRTEYHCIRCGGHQGHIFKDGPQPTGLRYCNNGLALKFIPLDQTLPELRG